MEIHNYSVISSMIVTYSNCYGSKEEEIPVNRWWRKMKRHPEEGIYKAGS